MSARIFGVVTFVGLLSVIVAGCAAKEPDDADGEEGSRSTADELSSGTVVRCGYGRPAGYVAQSPLCISTCGGCNPYGRNATQCVRARSGGGGSSSGGLASSVTCGFSCPLGLRQVQRLCISTCGGCNPYGSNAVQCSR